MANYNNNVLCSKALSSAAEGEVGERCIVELLIYRIEVLLVASHEHNLLPFSTPQSYALLSAKTKATEAANNKERLGECHNMCGAIPVFFRLVIILP